MFFDIALDQIHSVLLDGNGWVSIHRGSFQASSNMRLTGPRNTEIDTTVALVEPWFRFTTTTGDKMAGPLTSIIAVSS